MRPDSIRQFDYFYGASIALGVLNVFAGLDHQTVNTAYVVGTGNDLVASYVLTGGYGSSIWLGLLAVLAVPLAIWFFAAIRASQTARWIAVARGSVAGMRLAFLLYLLGWLILTHFPVTSWTWYCLLFGVIGETLQIAAVFFLFPEDARDWFEAGGPTAARPEEVFG